MEAGLIDELKLKAALAEQRKWGGKLGRTLVDMGFVDEDSMAMALSRQLGIPVISLDTAKLAPDVVQLMRVDVAERYGVFPVAGDRKTKTLTIASSDPTNMEAIQELQFHTGMKITVNVATASGIDRAIRRYYYGESTTSSATATPVTFGVTETTFDPDLLTRSGDVPKAANGSAPPELLERLDELTEKVASLERVMASQVKALRGVLELLVEKGVVSRDEYLSKVRRE